jgi:hypothetical protein
MGEVWEISAIFDYINKLEKGIFFAFELPGFYGCYKHIHNYLWRKMLARIQAARNMAR